MRVVSNSTLSIDDPVLMSWIGTDHKQHHVIIFYGHALACASFATFRDIDIRILDQNLRTEALEILNKQQKRNN